MKGSWSHVNNFSKKFNPNKKVAPEKCCVFLKLELGWIAVADWPLTQQHETKQQQSPKRQDRPRPCNFLPYYSSLKTCVYRIIIKVDSRRHPIKTSIATIELYRREGAAGGRPPPWISPLSNILLRRSRPVSIPLHPSRASDPSLLLTTPPL